MNSDRCRSAATAPAGRRDLAARKWLAWARPCIRSRRIWQPAISQTPCESAAIYSDQKLVHPRDILRSCNFVISRNVLLGTVDPHRQPVQHLRAVPVGSGLSVRARITRNYEHKGHAFVEIDALVLSQERTPVARIAHTAIYRPRQVAAA